MSDNVWQLQEAKSRFSELVERALSSGVQVVTRRGEKTVVVLPFADYERLVRRPARLSEFFLTSPLAGSELSLERDKSMPRDIEIEL